MLEKYSTTSMRQFSVFRIIFGIYLSWHFASLIPYAQEIFSQDGMMGPEGNNPFKDNGAWPNPFFIWGQPIVIQISLALGVVASILFTIGKFTRSCALGLWFLLSCLFTANPLTANPSLGYVGLLLLLCVIIPPKHTHLPRMVVITAWALLAIGYGFSGVHKLGSPSWIDGTAMHHLINNPLARPGMAREIMLMLPDGMLKIMTWGTLALEILFVPLVLFKSTRPYAWFAMLAMHIGIMFVVDFADLSLGMVMIHLFTFQRCWIPVGKSISSKQKPLHKT